MAPGFKIICLTLWRIIFIDCLNETTTTQTRSLKMELQTYTITWRPESDGDFFIQDYPSYKSASLAIAQWRRFWNLHESETSVFKVEKKES
jgi:hypothetical protein